MSSDWKRRESIEREERLSRHLARLRISGKKPKWESLSNPEEAESSSVVVSGSASKQEEEESKGKESKKVSRSAKRGRMDSFQGLVTTFHGRKDGREDPAEFIENLEFVIKEKKYDTTEKRERSSKMIFRMNLKNDALRWYQNLEAGTKSN